jgi:ferritin-like metal-binding protein YciE
MEALQKLLTHELADLYDAEQQILKALPTLIDESSSSELQQALAQHRTVTQKQVRRLDQIFRQLGEERENQRCKGMAGLIAEGEDVLEEDFEASTMDAAIIGAAQRVEHYEIAAYGTARTLAQTLGLTEIAQLLEESLNEEKEADERLTEIAESAVNMEAASEEEQAEDKSSSGNGPSRSKQSTRSKARSTRRARRQVKAGR